MLRKFVLCGLLILVWLSGVPFLQAGTYENVVRQTDRLLDRKDYLTALSVCTSFLSSDPDHAGILGRTGYLYYCLADYSNCIVFTLQAVKAGETNRSLYNNLGAAYYGLKRYQEAELAFRRSLELDPASSRTRYNLAASLFYQRRYGESFHVLTAVYNEDRKYFSSRFDRRKARQEVRRIRDEFPEDEELLRLEEILGELP